MSKQKLSPDVHKDITDDTKMVKTTQMPTSQRMDKYMVG